MFGNAHFNLGEKIVEKLDKKLSESEKNAFLSGIVYADIGRFKFDKETKINSDSEMFAEAMDKLAETSEEKWFVRGFKMHIIQDKETPKFLNDILQHKYLSYTDYMIDCGTLESYFCKKSGIIYNEFLDKFNFNDVTAGFDIKDLSKISGTPEDKIEDFALKIIEKSSDYPERNDLVLFDKLIQDTYKSLGFEIGLDKIHEQAGNVFGVFIIIPYTVGNQKETSKELASIIEEKSDALADLCVSKLEF
ncbi:MAG: hypothetical protein Q4D57_04315 [Clostridia bacterium]|nr:hypothetical protein [Clostridia bacterium]